MECPLCQQVGAVLYHRDRVREFFQCPSCTIIFVPRKFLLSPEEEKKRYDSHQNNEDDPAYRNYLRKTVEEVLPDLGPMSWGLDFGCGRTRLMEKLFLERGISMNSYDPFYHPDEKIWERFYTFGVLNEVIEHLHDPAGTIARLRKIIKGPIYVRTSLYPDSLSDFVDWFYQRDLTHVQFFSLKAMEFIGKTTKFGDDLYKIELK